MLKSLWLRWHNRVRGQPPEEEREAMTDSEKVQVEVDASREVIEKGHKAADYALRVAEEMRMELETYRLEMQWKRRDQR